MQENRDIDAIISSQQVKYIKLKFGCQHLIYIKLF